MTDAERLAMALQRSVPMASPTGEFIPTPPLPMQPQISPYNPIGIGETALNIGTSALAQPIASMYGVGSQMFGGDGKQAANRLADALTYQPTTEYGQASSQAFGEFADKSGLSSLPPFLGLPAPRVGAGAAKFAAQEYGTPIAEKGLSMYEQGKLTPGLKPVSEMFIGENAKNWDAAQNAKAIELEQAGVSPKEIWQQTMNWKGPEGKWRQEIDDSGSVFDPQKLRSTETIKTHEALTHDPVYQNYPALQYYELGWEQNPNSLGSFKPSEQKFTTAGGGTLFKPEQAKSTLLHEIGHAIQHKEDFARGGNPSAMPAIVDELRRQELKALEEGASNWKFAATNASRADNNLYMHKLDKLMYGTNVKPRQITKLSDFYEYSDKIRSEYGPMPKKPGVARDEWISNAAQYIKERNIEKKPYLADYDRKNPKDLQNQIRREARVMDKYKPDAIKAAETIAKYKDIKALTPEEQYMRSAGEAESRAIQSRMNLNMDERRALFPEQSFDRNMKDLIVYNKKNLPSFSRKELLQQEFDKLEK
jgi:hypothetical protein